MTDIDTDQALRPTTWDDFVGQPNLKRRLDVHVAAVRADFERGDHRMLEHILLVGPPGTGKTTISQIIATQTGDDFQSLVMPVKARVLRKLFIEWDGGVLLLDEIHRAPKAMQEDMLVLLEDGYYQGGDGQKLPIPALTVIGATTEPEQITPALYDRFPIKPTFEPYSRTDMARIIWDMAQRAGGHLDAGLCYQLAPACGGVPRAAKKFVFAARDLSKTGGEVDVFSILDLCGVDPDGLSEQHLAYLTALARFGGQAGLQAVCMVMRMHPSHVKDLERLLFDNRLVTFTKQGRELTSAGFDKIRHLVKEDR